MPSAIDPSQIPGANIDPDTIEAEARTVGTLAGQVRDHGSNVHLKWQSMAGVYVAPESATLLDLMQPVSSQATTAGDNLDVVSAALIQFAEDVRPIKAELDSLRERASAFGESIENGVQVREVNPAWTSAQGYQGSWNAYGAAGSTSNSDIPKWRFVQKEWHEVQEQVDRNNELIAAVNAQQVLLWEAERACANKIRALYGAEALRAAQSEDDALGYGIEEIPAGTEMPWGADVERTEGCGEATANFVFKDFLWEGLIVGGVWGTVTGLGTLVLGYNPETGGFFDPNAYGAAWGNLGQIAFAAAANTGILAPVFQTDSLMQQLGGDGFLPQEVRDFKAQADEAAINTGKALIAWDKWQDDPGTALGESVFNVGTALIPVGGAAVAGVKTASTAASVISRMARVADFVDPAAWAVNGTMRLGSAGLGSLDSLISRIEVRPVDIDIADFPVRLGPDDLPVYVADDAASALRALDEGGVDLSQVTARIDDGVPVYEFPGGRVEMPAGSFDAVPGVRGDGGADAAATAPVREPELVNAGGVRGETGPAPVNSIVDEAPVRTETSGGGESTIVREPESTTGGSGRGEAGSGSNGGGTGDGSGSNGGGAGDDSSAPSQTGAAGAGAGGGTPGYALPDGTPYTPTTSHAQVATSPDAEAHITQFAADRGLTVSDVHHLIHERPVSSLSPDEALLLSDLRDSVPMPANGEIMQKVLSFADAENLLTNAYGPDNTVGGFVARAADAQKLTTSAQIADGFGLDYGAGRTFPPEFTASDGSIREVYAVRFLMSDAYDLKVPTGDVGDQAGLLFDSNGRPYYRPAGMDPLGPDNPFLGNGFVGRGGDELIPEYHLPTRSDLDDGTEVWRITPQGTEELVAALINGKWVRF